MLNSAFAEFAHKFDGRHNSTLKNMEKMCRKLLKHKTFIELKYDSEDSTSDADISQLAEMLRVKLGLPVAATAARS